MSVSARCAVRSVGRAPGCRVGCARHQWQGLMIGQPRQRGFVGTACPAHTHTPPRRPWTSRTHTHGGWGKDKPTHTPAAEEAISLSATILFSFMSYLFMPHATIQTNQHIDTVHLVCHIYLCHMPQSRRPNTFILLKGTICGQHFHIQILLLF